MRVLLVQHFARTEPRTPIALMDLAAYGRSFGHTVHVAYADQVHQFSDYDFVGFSSLSLSGPVFQSLAWIRERYAGNLLLGGKCVQVLTPQDHKGLDDLGIRIHLGPGETLFSQEPIIYETYPVWEEGDFASLDRVGQMTEVMSSRGCPYHCHFCQNTEKKIQFFSTQRTIANLRLVLETFSRPRAFIVDDIFAMNTRRMYELLTTATNEGLDLRGKTKFFIHVSHLGSDILQAISDYGSPETQLGIESGDDRMLRAMGKTFSSLAAEDRLRKLSAQGTKASGLFLMGFPGETRESLQATVDFVNRNRQHMNGWWVSYYQPVPFTRGWEMAKERVGEEHLFTGGWNVDINYLDPNLTIRDLRDARWAVMLH